jgi:hypothetical protein
VSPLIKLYVDQVMLPDKQEWETSKSPEALATLHAEITQLIIDNLRLYSAGFTAEQQRIVGLERDKYFEGLRKDSGEWKAAAEGMLTGQDVNTLSNVAVLTGLRIPVSDGSRHEILDFGGDKIKGLRSNIRIQGGSNQFIHWETDAVTKAKLNGQEPNLDKRIYLNPKTSEVSTIFSTLMQSFNERGILVQGKMLDRSYDLARQVQRHEATPMRADAIVLVVGDVDADKALDAVLSIYRNNPAIFADRPVPKIPLKIAPGIAVGDEVIGTGESLTSHRAKIIESALALTRQRLGLDSAKKEKVAVGHEDEALSTFNAAFVELAKANGINPRNLAFNLPKTA